MSRAARGRRGNVQRQARVALDATGKTQERLSPSLCGACIIFMGKNRERWRHWLEVGSGGLPRTVLVVTGRAKRAP
jgi:hypothetical protein